MKKTIHLSDEIRELCPHLCVGTIAFRVAGDFQIELLDKALDDELTAISQAYDLSSWKERPAIKATREAYKRCQKDPNRYRPSAEQLGRRVLNGLGLYRVNPIVDWGNLISLRTGYSVSVFDEDQIVGAEILLRLGTTQDVYEGIGRGVVNIDRLPVYTDAIGGFASPTTDNERTKISPSSQNILMLVNDFVADSSLKESLLGEAIREIRDTASRMLGATDIEEAII